MTRKELSQVYYLKRELRMWEQKLQELREKSLIGSKEITDMPFANTGELHDTTFEYISQIMELQADIEAFRLNIERKIEEIEKFIMTLEDSFLRQIIEYRCIQGKTWEQTAMMIGYGTSGESCRKYFDRRFPKS